MKDIEKVFIPSKSENKFSFALKVKSGAKKNTIDGPMCIDGIWHLKLTIKAIPENGKANFAIIDFLAQEWSLPKKSIKIIKGMSSNYKVLSVEGAPDLISINAGSRISH